MSEIADYYYFRSCSTNVHSNALQPNFRYENIPTRAPAELFLHLQQYRYDRRECIEQPAVDHQPVERVADQVKAKGLH